MAVKKYSGTWSKNFKKKDIFLLPLHRHVIVVHMVGLKITEFYVKTTFYNDYLIHVFTLFMYNLPFPMRYQRFRHN
jgi:hypothetical protein